MTIVVMTGGIGSGKSEVARLFNLHGVPIVDTDVIAHQLTASNQAAITEIHTTFGAEFINTEGALDRPKMRAYIFKNPSARLLLEAILHPKIHAEALNQIAENMQKMQAHLTASNYQIVVVPLLFESQSLASKQSDSNQYTAIAKVKLVVDCTPELQISRTMTRSKLTEEAVRAIMQAQVSRETRLSQADEIIENNGNLKELTNKVNKMHEKLTRICLNATNI